MSIEAINWAWEMIKAGKCKTDSEKLVLLALADHSDDEGVCWPGQRGLAFKTNLSERTISRSIQAMEARGRRLILRGRRYGENGRRSSDKYILPLGQNETPDRLSGEKSKGRKSGAQVYGSEASPDTVTGSGESLPDRLSGEGIDGAAESAEVEHLEGSPDRDSGDTVYPTTEQVYPTTTTEFTRQSRHPYRDESSDESSEGIVTRASARGTATPSLTEGEENTESASGSWLAVKEKLREEMPAGPWQAWIEPLESAEYDRLGVLTLGVPDKFHANWIRKNFEGSILWAWGEVTGLSQPSRLELRLIEEPAEVGA